MIIHKQRFKPNESQTKILRAIDKKVKEIYRNNVKVNDFISFIRTQKQSSFRDFVIKRIHRLVKLFNDRIGQKRKAHKVFAAAKKATVKMADKVISKNHESKILFYRNVAMQGV